MPRRNTNRAGANVAATLDVRRRVADHDDVCAGDVDAQHVTSAALGDRRQLRTQLVVGAVRADDEHLRIDADCLELGARTLDEIPR